MSSRELSTDLLENCRNLFVADPKNLLAQNVIARSDPLDTCLQRKVLENNNHIFTNKVEEVKPATNQKSSGRCWIFAALNVMRIPFMKAKTLEDFEFSQAYLFFWDKVERSNYFLNMVAEVHGRTPKEEAEGRLLSFLLKSPISDGGQWDMFVNLVEKHGLMPKKCFPETYSCEKSARMNAILRSKLREFAHDIYEHMDANNDDDAGVNLLIQEQMKIIFRIVSICLGSPPKEFTWEYYDKAKKYHKIENISPQGFYQTQVKASFDVNSKVCLVSDPRPKNPTGQTYTVDCLGNMVNGRKTVYNNQPIEILVEVTAKSIHAGEPVWFGCEVRKNMASEHGLLDITAHDYQMVFNTNVNINLSKADRLKFGDSSMTHAMVFTGFNVKNYEEPQGDKMNTGEGDMVTQKGKQGEDVEMESNEGNGNSKDEWKKEFQGNITKWRVENSWGDDKNEKGYLTMTQQWFREYVFEVVVDKKFCSQEILNAFDLEPRVLPAWDPMGSLAKDFEA